MPAQQSRSNPHRAPQAARIGAAADEPRSFSNPTPQRDSRLHLSDDELRNSVIARLSQFGPGVTRHVRIDVRRGEVVLRGTVSCDYERRLVGQTIGRQSGIDRLENLISIRSADSPPPAKQARLKLPGWLPKLAWAASTLIGAIIALWSLC